MWHGTDVFPGLDYSVCVWTYENAVILHLATTTRPLIHREAYDSLICEIKNGGWPWRPRITLANMHWSLKSHLRMWRGGDLRIWWKMWESHWSYQTKFSYQMRRILLMNPSQVIRASYQWQNELYVCTLTIWMNDSWGFGMSNGWGISSKGWNKLMRKCASCFTRCQLRFWKACINS